MAKKPAYEELKKRVRELEDEVIALKRVAKELHESHDYLEKLFSYANAPIIVWDPKGRVTRFNRAFEHMIGIPADEVIGQKLNMLFPEATRDESLNKIANTLSGEYWESVEIPILRKDGDIRVALWNSANVYAKDGRTVIATIAQGQDISELMWSEEELRATRDYLNNLINYANAPIIVWDPETRITRFNRAFERLTGYKADEVIGQKLNKLFPEATRDESLNKIADTLKGEYWESVEIPILRKDEDIRIALWNSANIYAENSTILLATIAQGMDITERKRAEEALQESEERYRSILETAPHSITITRVKDGRYMQVNEAFCQMRGYSREEVLGRTPFELNLYVNPEDRERLIKVLKERGEVNGFEVQYQKRDGTAIDTIFSARPLEYGNEDCLIAVVTDVTELKGAQQALKKRLAYEKMLTDISTRAILIEDISMCLDECLEIMGKTLHVSRIYIFEYHNEPGTADNTFEWVSDGIAPQKENLRGIPMKKYPLWMEIMNNNKVINYKDIEDIPGEPEKEILRSQNIKSILVVPLFVNNAFYGFMGFDECRYHRKWLDEDVDILKTTAQIISNAFESKQAEDALRESEEQYRLLADNVIDIISRHSLDGTVLYVSPSVSALLGYEPRELIGTNGFNPLIPPDDLPKIQSKIIRLLKEEHSLDPMEHRMIKKNGNYVWVETASRLRQNTNNDQPFEVISVTRDITDRKKAEEALRESEEKYRILVENANDAIFVMQDQKVKFPNPRAIEMGRNLAVDLERVPFLNYIHPEDREMVIERYKKRIKGEEAPHTYTFRLMDREGEALWAELNAILINWEGKPATLNFLRDITKQKKLEAQLQQARRMEALGTLAGGIAHDFNNLLMGIQGRTSLMMDIDSSLKHYENLKGIEDIVKSAADLTKQLLGFARSGKYEVKPTDLNELIHKTSQMFGRTKKEIKTHTKYQKNIWAAEVDRGQIEQVMLNLYVNAWQAMPGGGDLYLQTDNVTLDENYAQPYEINPGRYVKISVTDTGVGMDKATQDRIFEPFFSTKEMARGIGLGLASTYGIIKNHGGIINVCSEKGEGATFDIYLPASEKEVIEEKKLPETVIRGTETILLVDDEDMIVGVGEKILKRMGYNVLTARA
ncbi:MAG: PAS domain S-box protein, partial [Desulfobacterales bacterium]|nr:PAS domain S-box protein [Desulfobacterales bacterium]